MLFLHRCNHTCKHHTCQQHQLSLGSWPWVSHTTGAKVIAVAQDLFIFYFCCMGHAIFSAETRASIITLRPLFTNTSLHQQQGNLPSNTGQTGFPLFNTTGLFTTSASSETAAGSHLIYYSLHNYYY